MNILDESGQPIDLASVRNDLARQADMPQSMRVGQIWREFENHPGRGLTPASLRSMLVQGEQGDIALQCDLADDMEECDPHLYAELDKRRGAVRQLDWDIVPPEDATAQERSLADEVDAWFGEIDVDSLVADALDAILKGFSALEMVWRPQQGILLPEITKRPQRWFTVDGTRDRLLLRNPTAPLQSANMGGVFVNPALLPTPAVNGEPLKALAWFVHRHRSKSGYLSRAGLLRVLAWPYLYKAYAWRDFAEFLEIYGLPLRLGKYPVAATDDEKMALLQAVTQLGHNAAGIMPQGMAVEFQQAAQGARDPFTSMLQYCDSAESKAILGQTLTASEGQNGTQALGRVHNQVRLDIRDSDVKQISQSVKQGLILLMVRINKGDMPGVRLPEFSLDNSEAEDITVYADKLPALAAAGMRIGVAWTHEKLRIPEASDGEAILRGSPAATAGATGTAGAAGAPGAAGAAAGASGQVGGSEVGATNDPAAAGAVADAGSDNPASDSSGGDGSAQAALAGRMSDSGSAAGGGDLIDQLINEEVARWRPVLSPLVEPMLAELDRAAAAGMSLEAFRAALPGLVARMDGTSATEQIARMAFSSRLAGEADLDLVLLPKK